LVAKGLLMNRDQGAILEEEEEGIRDVYPNTILVLEGFNLCQLGSSSTPMLQAVNLRMNRYEEWNQTHTTQQGRFLIPPLIHPLRRSNTLFYILPFLRQGFVVTLAKTVQGM
jgi:hypothetical protein